MRALARHLLVADRAQSILSALGLPAAGAPGFMPFGYRAPGHSRMAWNGQIPETSSNCYLLGNGHRAYYPVLGRFSRPDAWSPFGKGGLNAYVYCQGDPLNARDPSGRISVGFVLNGAFIAGGFATLGVGIWLVTEGKSRLGISLGVGAVLALAPALMGMGIRLAGRRTVWGRVRQTLRDFSEYRLQRTTGGGQSLSRQGQNRNPLANPQSAAALNQNGRPVQWAGRAAAQADAPPEYENVFELYPAPPEYSSQNMAQYGSRSLSSSLPSSPQLSGLPNRAVQIRKGRGRGVTSSL